MKRLVALLLLVFTLCLSQTALGAGIRLDQTRVIINSDSTSQVFSILNDDNSPYLIQTAITNELEGERSPFFIVTPPLFRLDAKSKFSAKILVNNKKQLPTDKESLFYLYTRAIPSTQQTNAEKNNAKLTFVTNIIIKVLYRPNHLAVPNSDIFKQVKLVAKGNEWQFNNPTPYYLTAVNIKINQQDYKKSLILPPFNQTTIKGVDSKIKTASWQMINDFGGLSDVFYYPVALSSVK
ncbi:MULTISPECIES: fimbrial biogenesis chaperone [Providencia]|uniref:fimbrial biogenesis chaperone n=1 Tax=Providencia TaxID=586 RepID=UPI001419F406|nr:MULTISPECIES: molecular chaperone [Providencia]EJD6081176.1 molecular chaperone [Providencia rettgeri]EJD6400809.1 molecular chaperone [Providencia rettgeri]EJD6581662.1 molecular chaperone [Providencia rettgeri]EJD6600575.1 molecular chaperone [Providencia rettgeri]EJD6614516.1 molecular chaperone [Providencia rettgeri]